MAYDLSRFGIRANLARFFSPYQLSANIPRALASVNRNQQGESAISLNLYTA
jgi:hypothetical protein